MNPQRGAEPGCRRALTLIEVVAALALLALVLGAAVSARGRLVRNRVAVDERRRAVEALDAALTDWWASGAPPAVGLGPGLDNPAGDGRAGRLMLADAHGHAWSWQSVAANEPALVRRGLRRVRITARPSARPGKPLVVDLLVPLGPAEETNP